MTQPENFRFGSNFDRLMAIAYIICSLNFKAETQYLNIKGSRRAKKKIPF